MRTVLLVIAIIWNDTLLSQNPYLPNVYIELVLFGIFCLIMDIFELYIKLKSGK